MRDVDAVVDAAGLDRFALVGICQGGPIAMTYAGRRPMRVDHLVLYGTYARGRNRRSDLPPGPEKARLMLEMLRLGWADEDHAFMRAFATQFQPQGSLEHLRSWCELQRRAASAESAVELTRIMFDIDVLAEASLVACPTLVAHPDRDAVAPLEEGRLLARAIPGARFLELDSPNHFMLADEPAWASFSKALHEFLDAPGAGAPEAFANLTPRERDILHLLARGLDNRRIGRELDISEKTVRNHVSAVFSKIGTSSRAEAVVLAREAGFGR